MKTIQQEFLDKFSSHLSKSEVALNQQENQGRILIF